MAEHSVEKGHVSERCPGREHCAALGGVCALQCVFHESDHPFTGRDLSPDGGRA